MIDEHKFILSILAPQCVKTFAQQLNEWTPYLTEPQPKSPPTPIKRRRLPK
jgi:hypothetical protein